MPKTEQQIVIEAPIGEVFDIIVDYERYPEFLPEMKLAQIQSQGEGISVVAFELEIIMRLGYVLRLVEDRPHAVSWTLEEAKMFAFNSGGWQLEDLGGTQTRATYGLEIKLRGLIPKSVSSRLIGTTLPNTLQRFKDRIEGRPAGG